MTEWFVAEEKADRHAGNLAYPGDVLLTSGGRWDKSAESRWRGPTGGISYPRAR